MFAFIYGVVLHWQLETKINHLLKTDGKDAFKLRKFVVTEGVGLDLLTCVGLNFFFSSSSSIFRVSGFLGSSTYSGKRPSDLL